jgi:Tfp pilus assembly protein PilF
VKFLVLVVGGTFVYLVLKSLFKKSAIFGKILLAGFILFILFVVVISSLPGSSFKDKQCLSFHETNTKPPLTLISAKDYLEQGDFDYDRGDCGKAISDYTKAIELDPKYAEAYNNRAYVNMRMRAYANALSDLNRALELRPNYVHALMNRGDIYNFYYNIDKQKAIKDYDRAIALGATQENTSVCGHRKIAKEGWHPGIFLLMFRNPTSHGC